MHIFCVTCYCLFTQIYIPVIVCLCKCVKLSIWSKVCLLSIDITSLVQSMLFCDQWSSCESIIKITSFGKILQHLSNTIESKYRYTSSYTLSLLHLAFLGHELFLPSFFKKKSIHVYFVLLCRKYSCIMRASDCDVEFAAHG